MTKSAVVLRILDRYLVEVVEKYELCPWARGTRTAGELAVAVVWGTPTLDEWAATARELLARPATRVAMVVAPELVITPRDLHAVRERVAGMVTSAGIAEFHPTAELDLATPARLVPFLRRSPDPLLQLVPFALLDAVRARKQPALDLAQQAAMLRGELAFTGPPPDLGDRIADTNHATVSSAVAAITATLASIAADRAASYAAAGISTEDRRR